MIYDQKHWDTLLINILHHDRLDARYHGDKATQHGSWLGVDLNGPNAPHSGDSTSIPGALPSIKLPKKEGGVKLVALAGPSP
jgi:hypothetical protein